MARCHPATVLEPGKGVLDLVTAPVEGLVMRDRHLPGCPGPNAKRNAILFQCVRHLPDLGTGAIIVADLSGAQRHPKRTPKTIHDRVRFRVQAALRPANLASEAPSLSRRLTAVRCTFGCVASTINILPASPCATRPNSMRAKMPFSLQRS